MRHTLYISKHSTSSAGRHFGGPQFHKDDLGLSFEDTRGLGKPKGLSQPHTHTHTPTRLILWKLTWHRLASTRGLGKKGGKGALVGLLQPRSSCREAGIRVPFFAVVYFSRGTLPPKRGGKGTTDLVTRETLSKKGKKGGNPRVKGSIPLLDALADLLQLCL